MTKVGILKTPKSDKIKASVSLTAMSGFPSRARSTRLETSKANLIP